MRNAHEDPDLLAAALLHDAGKALASLSVIHRSAAVLLQAAGGRWMTDLDQNASKGWRKPFWVHQRHAELGAELAEDAGCSEVTVWLIRHHHHSADQVGDAPERRRTLLTELQQCDSKH